MERHVPKRLKRALWLFRLLEEAVDGLTQEDIDCLIGLITEEGKEKREDEVLHSVKAGER